jgi:hypothetical protein
MLVLFPHLWSGTSLGNQLDWYPYAFSHQKQYFENQSVAMDTSICVLKLGQIVAFPEIPKLE